MTRLLPDPARALAVFHSPGASDAGPDESGESYVVFGRTTGFPAEFALSSLLASEGGDGSEGFILRGVGDDAAAGISVSAAGDVNSDGIDDLIIGALNARPDELSNTGESYVVFGRATTPAGNFTAEFD